MFLKDIEKAIIGNYEVLKSKLESLPQNVVVIGSHTQLDNRKDKVLFHDCVLLAIFDSVILLFDKIGVADFHVGIFMVTDPAW